MLKEDHVQDLHALLPTTGTSRRTALKVPLLAEVGVGPNWEQAH